MFIVDWAHFTSDGRLDTHPDNINSSTNNAVIINNTVNEVNTFAEIKHTFGGAVDFTELPPNYEIYRVPRGNVSSEASKSEDSYIYGNPRGTYRSAAEFAPHAVSILLANPAACKCKHCNRRAWDALVKLKKEAKLKDKGVAKPKPSAPLRNRATARSSPRTSIPHSPITQPGWTSTASMKYNSDEPPASNGTDEDGTPNVFDQLLEQARQGAILDQPIIETKSLEWLLEREVAELPEYLATIGSKQRWIPRLGEIVLIVRDLEDNRRILYDEYSGIFQLCDADKKFVGIPTWEAAVVTQLPSYTNDINHEFAVSVLHDDSTDNNSVTDGYRVEPMSEIGNPSKPWSKRYTFVKMPAMRPFQFWQELLSGLDISDPRQCHPTIPNALTVMSSFSLIERHRFTSDGHEARTYCKGIFIGAEFLTIGDIVRFTSPVRPNDIGKHVIHISKIYLSARLDHQPEPLSVHIIGKGYTIDPHHAIPQYQRPIPTERLPFKGMEGYGCWYKMSEGDNIRVPYSCLQSRLLEDYYTKTLIGTPSVSRVAPGLGARNLGTPNHIIDMSYGVEGVVSGRMHSRQFDSRIARGNTWFFAENRTEQLELHLINGQDVGDKARFGFESSPKPLQEAHLKAMFRARGARQRGSRSGSSYAYSAPSGKQFAATGLVASGMNAGSVELIEEDESIDDAFMIRSESDMEIDAFVNSDDDKNTNR